MQPRIVSQLCTRTVRSKLPQVLRRKPVTFMEVYGRGAICGEALKQRRNQNIDGLDALDMRTHKPDGSTWNFNLRKDRVLARQMIDEKDPD